MDNLIYFLDLLSIYIISYHINLDNNIFSRKYAHFNKLYQNIKTYRKISKLTPKYKPPPEKNISPLSHQHKFPSKYKLFPYVSPPQYKSSFSFRIEQRSQISETKAMKRILYGFKDTLHQENATFQKYIGLGLQLFISRILL